MGGTVSPKNPEKAELVVMNSRTPKHIIMTPPCGNCLPTIRSKCLRSYHDSEQVFISNGYDYLAQQHQIKDEVVWQNTKLFDNVYDEQVGRELPLPSHAARLGMPLNSTGPREKSMLEQQITAKNLSSFDKSQFYHQVTLLSSLATIDEAMINKVMLQNRLISPFISYRMNEERGHGCALIINNISVDGREEREGATEDGLKLSHTMRSLGYKLVGGKVHINCNAYTIKQLIKEATNIDHTHNDSFICCLMSHGKSNCIYGTDNQPVLLGKVINKVCKCKSLFEKPKIFFVQACREGTEPLICNPAVLEDRNTSIRDVFIGYATSPNTNACRFTDTGSWYITELCKAFDENPLQDLLTIVQIAQHEVCTKDEYTFTYTKEGELDTRRSYRQSPQMFSTLIGPVYFNW